MISLWILKRVAPNSRCTIMRKATVESFFTPHSSHCKFSSCSVLFCKLLEISWELTLGGVRIGSGTNRLTQVGQLLVMITVGRGVDIAGVIIIAGRHPFHSRVKHEPLHFRRKAVWKGACHKSQFIAAPNTFFWSWAIKSRVNGVNVPCHFDTTAQAERECCLPPFKTSEFLRVLQCFSVSYHHTGAPYLCLFCSVSLLSGTWRHQLCHRKCAHPVTALVLGDTTWQGYSVEHWTREQCWTLNFSGVLPCFFSYYYTNVRMPTMLYTLDQFRLTCSSGTTFLPTWYTTRPDTTHSTRTSSARCFRFSQDRHRCLYICSIQNVNSWKLLPGTAHFRI
jgi:hypothetical protein